MTMFTPPAPDFSRRAAAIKMLVMDVDGVLTTGQLFIGSNGEAMKPFHTLDGHGIKMLQESGVATAIITARNDAAVQARADALGITHYFKGVHDKKEAFAQLCTQSGIAPENCAFIGDDVIDLPVMVRCGLPVAVANAHPFVKQYAAYTTQHQGGFGAVRELCDLIMHCQGTLEAALNGYLQ